MSSVKSDLIFTVDSKYYIKATLKSLPHLVYGLDSTKLRYTNEVVQKDFAKWRTGDYDYEELPKQKSIVIRENDSRKRLTEDLKDHDRVYTFTEIGALSPPEIMWAFFDEICRLNESIQYSHQNDASEDKHQVEDHTESEILEPDTSCLDSVIDYLYVRNLGQNLGIQLLNPHDLSKMSLEQKADIIRSCLDETINNLKARINPRSELLKDPEYEPLINADLRDEFDNILKRIEHACRFRKCTKPNDVQPDNCEVISTMNFAILDDHQETEYTNLNLLEAKIAKLVEGYKILDKELQKFVELTQEMTSKFLASERGLECVLAILSKFDNLNAGFPVGMKTTIPKPIAEMTIDEKVTQIVSCYNSVIDQYDYNMKFYKLQINELQTKFTEEQKKHDMILAVRNAEISNMKQINEADKKVYGEIHDLWKDTCVALDKLAKDHTTLPAEHTALKNELFEKSKNSTEFDVVSVDYTFSSIGSDNEFTEFNNYLQKVAIGFVIGLRGYWFGGQRIKFNVVQIVCNKSKPYMPFTGFLVAGCNIPNDPDQLEIIAHDMLYSFNNITLRFSYKEYHLLTIDESKFVSQTISSYIDHCSTKLKTELSKALKNSSDFEVAEITYKTNIIIDFSDPNMTEYLKSVVLNRMMKIVRGEGHWQNPVQFVITKLTFKSENIPALETNEASYESSDSKNKDSKDKSAHDSDDFEEVENPKLECDLMTKFWKSREEICEKSGIMIRAIEKYMKKISENPSDAIIVCSNTSNTNYNTNLLLKF